MRHQANRRGIIGGIIAHYRLMRGPEYGPYPVLFSAYWAVRVGWYE